MLFGLVNRILYVCNGVDFRIIELYKEVTFLNLYPLWLLLLMLLQHLLPHLVFLLVGELRTIYQQVFITSAVATHFLLVPRWGLSALLVASFACFCLQSISSTWLSTLPVVRWWLDCFHEGHPGLRACKNVLPGLWFHKMIRVLCGLSVWLGYCVELLCQPGFF